MIPLTLICATALAFAEPAAENVLPLSLKQAIKIALAADGSPKVALAEESIKLAQSQIKEARAALLPDIESSLSDRRQTTNLKAFGFDFAFPMIPGFAFTLPDIVGPFQIFDARATASQTIYDFAAIKRYQSVESQRRSDQARFRRDQGIRSPIRSRARISPPFAPRPRSKPRKPMSIFRRLC